MMGAPCTIVVSNFGKGFFKPVVSSSKEKQTTPRERVLSLLQINEARLQMLLLYRSRKVMLHLESAKEAKTLHEKLLASQLQVNGRELQMELVEFAFDSSQTAQHGAGKEQLQREVTNCLDQMIRELVRQEAANNHRIRVEERKRHKKLIRQAQQRFGHLVDDDVCWNYVVSGGKCDRKNCRFRHELVSLSHVPYALRAHTFSTRDSFPAERREESSEKLSVNETLVELSAALPNKQCVVLDGEGLMSTTCLLRCPRQNRSPVDIIVPNSCSETYLTIRERGLCIPHFGSLRSFIDTRTAAQHACFGLVYCDYCCSLYAGKYSVEKSPIADIAAIFDTDMLDPRQSVLAVTLAKPDRLSDEETEQQEEAMTALVRRCAGARGMQVRKYEGQRFDFESTFVTVFLCGSF